MSSLQHVSTQSFASEVMQSTVPVLVDFYADWCGPCRMLAPTLERLSTEFTGRAKIVKVNIDHDPALASQFQVSAIPTLALIADGKVINRTTGLVGEATLRNVLNQISSAA